MLYFLLWCILYRFLLHFLFLLILYAGSCYLLLCSWFLSLFFLLLKRTDARRKADRFAAVRQRRNSISDPSSSAKSTIPAVASSAFIQGQTISAPASTASSRVLPLPPSSSSVLAKESGENGVPRPRSKIEKIATLLNAALTTVETVQASFGTAVFFEVCFCERGKFF